MKRARIILPLAAVIACPIVIAVANNSHQAPDQNGHNTIVVSVPDDVDHAAVQTANTVVGLSGSVADAAAGSVGSDAKSFLNPTAEAVLERGAQADMLASQQRMLERQKSMPDNASSSAIDTPGVP